MGQKVNPIVFRLPVRKDWKSRWFADKKNFSKFLNEDFKIRDFIKRKLKYASIANVEIERSGEKIRVKIFTPRPGVVIGVKGKELDRLTSSLSKITCRDDVIVDIQEVKKPDLVAQLVSDSVASQLERRVAFRRALKKAIQTAMSFGAYGIKIRCSGRLGGAEIARSEEQKDGSVPLHTLRANVDYGFSEAYTMYGIIGIKCWICNKQLEGGY